MEERSGQAEVVRAAEKALADFKVSFEAIYEQSTSLFRTAKALHQKIHDVLTEGKIRVDRGETKVQDLDGWLKRLLDPEKSKWERLLGEEENLLKMANDVYQPVTEAEAAVIHARGEGSNVAWMGIPTEEQAAVRKAYHLKLSKDFAEAKSEYLGLVGYPDGLLRRVLDLKNGAEVEEKNLLEKIRRRAEELGCVRDLHLDVLNEASRALDQYKHAIEPVIEESDELFQAAKHLYEQAHETLNDGKLRVRHGEWTVDELDERVDKLLNHQQLGWDKILAEGKKLIDRVNEIYEPVSKAEAAVRYARGEPPNIAWMGFLTKEQATARKTYSMKLKKDFADAKLHYDGLVKFPDGVLDRLHHLKNGSEIEARGVLDELRRSGEHPRVHKMFRINPLPKIGSH